MSKSPPNKCLTHRIKTAAAGKRNLDHIEHLHGAGQSAFGSAATKGRRFNFAAVTRKKLEHFIRVAPVFCPQYNRLYRILRHTSAPFQWQATPNHWAKKLRMIFSPTGVRMDSGWNCMPCTG